MINMNQKINPWTLGRVDEEKLKGNKYLNPKEEAYWSLNLDCAETRIPGRIDNFSVAFISEETKKS